ncbi:MAG: hypothetical protein QXP06_07440 [Candidatus Bathyarchaeia archaeon]
MHEKGKIILADWLRSNGYNSPFHKLSEKEIEVLARLERAKATGDIFVFKDIENGKKEYLMIEVKTCSPQYWRQAVLLGFAQVQYYRYLAHYAGLDSIIKAGVALVVSSKEWQEEIENLRRKPLTQRLKLNIYLNFLRDYGITLYIVDLEAKKVKVLE